LPSYSNNLSTGYAIKIICVNNVIVSQQHQGGQQQQGR